MRCAPILAVLLLLAASAPARAQSAVEGHASFGLVNVSGPAFAAGADVIRPSGATLGAAGLLTSGANDLSAFGAVLMRAGRTQRRPGTQGFLVGELGFVSVPGWSSPLMVAGGNGGATFWGNRPWAVRLEGRGLFAAGGGFVVVAQAGLTLR